MCERELIDFQMEVLTTIKNIKQRRVSNQQPFQQQHVNAPLASPAMSHSDSYQCSLLSFDYQSPPPSNQMEHQQQEQSSQRFLTNYTGANKYQQLFDDTVK